MSSAALFSPAIAGEGRGRNSALLTNKTMQLSNVNCEYGAPMGRPSSTRQPAPGVKFHLSRVRLNSGGYDSGGAYWGIGAPLYHAWGEGEEEILETFTRGASREDAKAAVVAKFPGAEFYR